MGTMLSKIEYTIKNLTLFYDTPPIVVGIKTIEVKLTLESHS